MTTGHPTANDRTRGLLIRHVRPVLSRVAERPISGPGAPLDVRVTDGRITEIAPHLSTRSDGAAERELDGQGRWLIPGLWDAHVHLSQWARTGDRLDVSGTERPADVASLVAAEVASSTSADATIWGQGFRSAPWQAQPTVAELDAISGVHPVVLISGDAHNGWLNSAALQRIGLGGRTAPLEENEWFAVLPVLQKLLDDDDIDASVARAVRNANRRGVVGIVDFEFAANVEIWPARFARGIDTLRVRAATYPDRLADVIAASLRSGEHLVDESELITMGPLKIISDGSLNTRTAYCCEPYDHAHLLPAPRGTQNVGPDELSRLLRTGVDHGLAVAVHAIGDAAVADALDAFAATGAAGSIEHAQLVRTTDVARMGLLGVSASVQPAHLLDDRDVTQQYWADRADRCFPLRSMIDSGVQLALGSDAPVAPLDPWLAMAAAVHRSADDRDPWNPAEAITATEALGASTDGCRLQVGEPADLVLLDDDPLQSFDTSREVADHLRRMRVAATVVAGRVVHQTF